MPHWAMGTSTAEIVRLAATATAEECEEVLRRDGAVIVERLVATEVMDRIAEELAPWIAATPTGADDFTGTSTRRTGALIARSVTFRDLAAHPLVLGTLDRVLGDHSRYQLHLTQVIDIGPGETAQVVHRDQWAFDFFPFPAGYEVECHTMWAMTDFTEANGATRVIPGSNHWADRLRPSVDDTVAAAMPKGSVMLYLGSVYHGAGRTPPTPGVSASTWGTRCRGSARRRTSTSPAPRSWPARSIRHWPDSSGTRGLPMRSATWPTRRTRSTGSTAAAPGTRGSGPAEPSAYAAGMARIAAGSDHAGRALKDQLVEHLRANGHEVDDLGTHDDARVDYPDYGAAVARRVTEGGADVGLCVCGSGIGISIAANKVRGARAALVHDVTTARLAREHNDANVICIGERTTGPETARQCVDAFLAAGFEGGRHVGRLDKISALEG